MEPFVIVHGLADDVGGQGAQALLPRRERTRYTPSVTTPHPTKGVLAVVAPRVAGLEGLELLILHGSRARGDATPSSDWDLGYLAGPELRAEDLLAALVEGLGTDRVDLVDLARAGALLRYRAARDARLVWQAHPLALPDFQLGAATFWCDTEPVLRPAYEAYLRGLG